MDWGELARNQAGVITRRQLRATGLTDPAITRLRGNGALIPRTRGVFVVRGAPMTYPAMVWAAVLAVDGVVGFGTAAHLWRCVERPTMIDILIPEARRVTEINGVRIRRSFLPPDRVVFPNGFPMTTRSWSLLDHLGELPASDAIALADRALQRSWLTPRDFAQRVSEFPQRSGNVTLRKLLDRTSDNAAAESERRLHSLLKKAGIADWVANYEVRHQGELVAVVDVAFPQRRIAIEVDGMAYHVDAQRFQRDRTRQNSLVALGWTVLRFTWADLVHRPGYVIAAVRRAA